MNWCKYCDSFHFKYNRPVNHKVQREFSQELLLKIYLYWEFPIIGHFFGFHQNLHRFLIKLFREARPQFVMDMHRRTNHLIGDGLLRHCC